MNELEKDQQLFNLEEKLTCLDASAASYERRIRAVLDRYGTGVRPSWISTDLAIWGHYAKAARADMVPLQDQLKKLKGWT